MSVILDQYGKPLRAQASTFSLPTLPSPRGWVNSLSDDRIGEVGFSQELNLQAARQAARLSYFTNSLFYGAISTIVSYLIGKDLTYSDDLADRRAADALEQFWALNSFDWMAERFAIEYLLDGENASVFSTDEPQRGVLQRFGFLDINKLTNLKADTFEGVTELETTDDRNAPVTYRRDRLEFVWSAADALYNRARGFPISFRAVGPALAYINLINSRLRINDLQGRINAVYHALINTATEDGGAAEMARKSNLYNTIPKDGAVVTLFKDLTTGQQEELRLVRPETGASDADTDARMIKLLFAVALNLPMHWLSDGENANRATSENMAAPTQRALLRRQETVRAWANAVFRLSLKRMYGPTQLYIVKRVRYLDGNRTRVVERRRVTADLLEIPLHFPQVQLEDMDAIIKKVDSLARLELASKGTLASQLGVDYALETERMQTESGGRGPQPPRQP